MTGVAYLDRNPTMTLRRLLPASLALALCACSQTAAPPAAATDAPQAQAEATADAPSTPAAAAEGSLDLDFTVRSLALNSQGDTSSAQCQITFTATNRSQAPVKSVIAEFRITLASDGSVIEETETLVMPFAIAPGETKESWGANTIDNYSCDDIQIALVPVNKYGMCLTKDESPCPAYRLSGEGVAIVE